MINYEITKKTVLDSSNGGTNSDAYKYYLINGRIFNDEKTRFRRFKFCVLIYTDTVFEFDGYPDFLTPARQKEVMDEIITTTADGLFYGVKNYDNAEGLQEFFNACNKTIDDYNEHIKRRY